MYLLYFTGMACSGKTTIAKLLTEKLKKKHTHIKFEWFDGDVYRKTLCKDLGYTKKAIEKSNDRINFVNKYLVKNDILVIMTSISPFKSIREKVRKEFGDRFIEIHVKAPLEICKERDVKGMWEKAINGELKNFCGVNFDYEEPINPEIICDTTLEDSAICAGKIISYLAKKGII